MVGITEKTAHQHAQRAVFMQESGKIGNHLLADIPHTRLMQCAERTRQQPGGDENQKHTRPTEKFPQIQTNTTLIQQNPDRSGSQKPGRRAQRHTAVGTLREHRNQEKHTLQALAHHGQKSHQYQSPARTALVERGLNRVLQLLLHRPRGLLHPQQHIGQHAHRQQTDHADNKFLLLLRNLARDTVDGKTQPEANQHSRRHAQPHLRHQIMMAGLFQKSGHNTDNQRRFDTLAQHNQKSNQHKNSF